MASHLERTANQAAKRPVLVIEDEASIRRGLCDVLAFHGYAPEGVERGDDGLASALRNQHALVVLDVMLPGLNGFVGEFLCLVGAFQTNRLVAVLATTGVILAAVYMLWMVKRVFYGQVVHEENRNLKDLNGRELAIMIPIVVLYLVIGLYPKPLLSRMEPSVNHLLAQIRSAERHMVVGKGVQRPVGALTKGGVVVEGGETAAREGVR